MAIEIVDVPITHGDFPWFFVCLPEGTTGLFGIYPSVSSNMMRSLKKLYLLSALLGKSEKCNESQWNVRPIWRVLSKRTMRALYNYLVKECLLVKSKCLRIGNLECNEDLWLWRSATFSRKIILYNLSLPGFACQDLGEAHNTARVHCVDE